MRASSFFPALLVTVAAAKAVAPNLSPRQLSKRQTTEVCTDLTISSNNGDRKVVLVIDSSGSMLDYDPDDLRLAAARSLNDFLISNGEAGGERKADQVAVVGFNSSSYTVFPPGDPADPAADEAISGIIADGGTYIASGVYEAIDHINAMPGDTKDRSAIVVFTDGSDSDTAELVSAINEATGLGIRVSFGYLDSGSSQPDEVLLALRQSKGVYATIAFAAGSQNFVNYVLLNGLTYQDNPQGAGDRLLAGLATTQFIDGPGTVALKYNAAQGERVNFTIVSFTGDRLNVEAKMGSQTLYASTRATSSRQFFDITAPGSGQLDVFVTSPDSPTDGLFSVLTNSNQPIKNCTVGVSNKDGSLSPGAKAGVAVGVIAGVAAMAGAAFVGYKYFFATGADGAAPTGGLEGNQGSFDPRAEKVQPHTSVSPLGQQPLDGPPTNGMLPPGAELDGNLTGQNYGVHDGGFYNIPPNGAPPTGPSGVPPMDMPPTGGPGGGGGIGAPSAFVPPMMPPLLSQKDPASGSIDSHQTNTSQQPLYKDSYQSQQSLSKDSYQSQQAFSKDSYQTHHSTYTVQYQQHVYQQPLGSHPGGGYTMDAQPTGGTGTGTDPHCQAPTAQDPKSIGPAPVDPKSIGPSPTPSHPDMGTPGCQEPTPGGNGGQSTSTTPGFNVPSPPSWQQQQNKDEDKHHHHPWLAPDMACEHPECELNLAAHVCSPSKETCVCVCRDAKCPVLKARRG